MFYCEDAVPKFLVNHPVYAVNNCPQTATITVICKYVSNTIITNSLKSDLENLALYDDHVRVAANDSLSIWCLVVTDVDCT